MTDANNNSGYFAYLLNEPVDLGFGDLLFAIDIVKSSLADGFEEFCKPNVWEFETAMDAVVSVLNLLQAARELLPQLGWEYDASGSSGLRVFHVPHDNRFSHALFVKQHGNGTSFIVSPVALGLGTLEFRFLRNLK